MSEHYYIPCFELKVFQILDCFQIDDEKEAKRFLWAKETP